MHPPLILERHPLCAKYMLALQQCHKEHSVAKWWGACNDAKWALSNCLAEEKKVMRAERQEAARARFRRLRAESEARMAAAAAQQEAQQQEAQA